MSFFQNFIDPEKLQVISNTFNENNSDVIAFLYENINKLNDPLILNISNIFNSKGRKTVEKLVLLFIHFF